MFLINEAFVLHHKATEEYPSNANELYPRVNYYVTFDHVCFGTRSTYFKLEESLKARVCFFEIIPTACFVLLWYFTFNSLILKNILQSFLMALTYKHSFIRH